MTLVNNTYDEVGRLKSDSRNGNAKLKTEYAYNVRSWTKSITGTLFSQTLNYQEAITGNTPCYNGNISSMSWKAGSETSPRGYRFTYDGLSRLKDALYGEGTTLAANTDRFNEQVTGYDKMGNILGLKRYGQTAASTYGLIDHLALTYNGNRLQAVKDAATNSVYGNGTEFKDGSNQTTEYTYDKNGNLTKDLNKDISKIGYNLLNLPDEVTFANGNSIRYEYAADGTKLRTVHKTGATTLTTDYCGNAVYENGVLRMLLNEAGYVSFPDRKFHFYLKDHQGNTRVVADKDGNVEETNAYYPFGGTFTSTASVQPYKYNGKELDAKNGLNWYDYGARQYDPTLGRFMKIDRYSEKYYTLSPFQYGVNSPTNNIDINGDSIAVLNHGEGMHMAILIQNNAGKWQYYSVNGDNVYVLGKFKGGRKFDDIAVGEFTNPQEFLDSEYNSAGKSDDNTINHYGFSEGYIIPTTEEQDNIIRDSFVDISRNEDYDLLGNNCSTTVQKAMEAAGLKTYESDIRKIPIDYGIGESYISIKSQRPIIPSHSFRAIIRSNPQGKLVYRKNN